MDLKITVKSLHVEQECLTYLDSIFIYCKTFCRYKLEWMIEYRFDSFWSLSVSVLANWNVAVILAAEVTVTGWEVRGWPAESIKSSDKTLRQLEFDWMNVQMIYYRFTSKRSCKLLKNNKAKYIKLKRNATESNRSYLH